MLHHTRSGGLLARASLVLDFSLTFDHGSSGSVVNDMVKCGQTSADLVPPRRMECIWRTRDCLDLPWVHQREEGTEEAVHVAAEAKQDHLMAGAAHPCPPRNLPMNTFFEGLEICIEAVGRKQYEYEQTLDIVHPLSSERKV